MEKQKNLFEEIKLGLETMPGIGELANLEGDENEENWINLTTEGNTVIIDLGIIIKKNVFAKNLINEIESLLKLILKNFSYKLQKLNVYIKGVK